MIYLQYEHSSKLIALVDALKSNINVSISQFYYTFFNINTCGTSGLDNWGRILNRTRTVYLPQVDTEYDNTLGFAQVDLPSPGKYPQNFYYSNFAVKSTNKPLQLNNAQYRALLKFTYLVYTTNATLKSANYIMNYYYNPNNDNGKQVMVQQTNSMEYTYTFNFNLQGWEILMFNNQNVLPTPICVKQILIYG